MAAVTISTLISSICSVLTMPNVFIHGQKGFQNLIADNALELNDDNCLIFLDEPITSDDTFSQGGAVESKYAIKMMFAQKSAIGWTQQQHDECIIRMRALSREFGLRILATKNTTDNTKIFKSLTNASRLNVMNVLDVNLSGVLFSFSVEPFDDNSICVS